MESLLSKTQDQYRRNLPFVVYALPESDTINALFQKDDAVYSCHEFTDIGFVFTPFTAKPALFIPEAKSEVFQCTISERITPIIISSEENDSEKKTYQTLVNKAIDLISSGGAQKIVTSRRKEIAVPGVDLSVVISRLFGLYPGAFRYVWHHPESGTWCGATPEILLETYGKKFNTMALAGTQTFNATAKPKWTPKELNEQEWVVEAITLRLEPITAILKISNTKNHRAGSLVHLRTDFEGIFNKKVGGLAHLARALHPTPAVCGTPREVAKDFILTHENYDRSYYTGFLGPINTVTGGSHLFVNLRCMKISDPLAHLFVGGGITEDSQAEAEWEETQHKLQTMLQVLAPMLSNNN